MEESVLKKLNKGQIKLDLLALKELEGYPLKKILLSKNILKIF